MRKLVTLVAAVLVAGSALGQSFTDIDSPQYEGKTADKARNAAIDANFALVEAGADVSYAGLTVTESLTAISTNGATTNIIVTVDGVVDGETIGDDTIDDDSIDFGDVTGADLTLTDCGAVSCSTLTASSTVTLTDVTAAGAVTPAATNAPALVSTTDAAYINVTIGGEVYVITAYQLDD